MAKPIDLSDEALSVQPVPLAAQDSPETKLNGKAEPKRKPQKQGTQQGREPYQLRLSAEVIRKAKVAAVLRDFPSVSDYVTECIHFYEKNNRKVTA
jgi:hypothetical protein